MLQSDMSGFDRVLLYSKPVAPCLFKLGSWLCSIIKFLISLQNGCLPFNGRARQFQPRSVCHNWRKVASVDIINGERLANTSDNNLASWLLGFLAGVNLIPSL